MTSFIIACLVRGALVSIVGVTALGFVRKKSARTRYAVSVLFLAAMLALPIGLAFAPKRSIPIAAPDVLHSTISVINASPSIARPTVADPASGPQMTDPSIRIGWLEWFAILWGLGAGLLILRNAVGMGRVARIIARSKAVSAFDGTSVRESTEVNAPIAAWFGRSHIILPSESSTWTEERRNAVMLHEKAHILGGHDLLQIPIRLTLALHWCNPLAWSLGRSARRAAEDAADDEVLCAGVSPSAYASELLDLATGLSFPAYASAIPMAQAPDVHRRIKNVLNPRRTRGALSLVAMTFTTVIFMAVFVPAVGFSLRHVRVPTFADMLLSQSRSSSWAPDVRDGKSIAGDETNGYVGVLADGRQVSLIQISMKTPSGHIVAWKPDGQRIPESDRIDVPMLGADTHSRTLLIRYLSQAANAEGYLGSASSDSREGRPNMEVFAGGGNRAGSKPGVRESYSFIGLPKEDGYLDSFTFGLSDEPWTTEATLSPNPGVKADSGRLTKVAVAYPTTANPFALNKQGQAYKDANGTWVHDKVRSTCLSFLLSPEEFRGLQVSALLKDGRTVTPFWNGRYHVDGDDPMLFHQTWYFRERPNEIASIKVESRASHHLEFDNVYLKYFVAGGPTGR